jgi:YVTN family beta-propeller protein
MKSGNRITLALLLASLLSGASAVACGEELPDGQSITPTAAPGSTFSALNPGLSDRSAFAAGQAVTTVVSPDGQTLLVLTSGYNRNYDSKGQLIPKDSNEYVFVFDIGADAAVQKQVIQVPNTFGGMTVAPDGTKFYVSGGKDDSVHTYAFEGGKWAESGHAIILGHTHGNGLDPANTSPVVAGLAVTADGKTTVAANYENDSISLVNLTNGTKSAELDLRPGKNDARRAGFPGGEFPYWIAVRGSSMAYVSSVRDREIVVVDLRGSVPRITGRIELSGQPNRMILNRQQTRLYVTLENADQVAVIDTGTNAVLQRVSAAAPPGLLDRMVPGASPNSLTFSPDGKTLYVTNGGTNSLAVMDVASDGLLRVTGLIPTGWYPSSVSVSADGRTLYIVNSKSSTGPNPAHCRPVTGIGPGPGPGTDPNYASACPASLQNDSGNQYTLQLAKAGFLTMPVPTAAQLAGLTAQVARNNGFNLALTAGDRAVLQTLRRHIKHVIYIVKENRTYDQILGDMATGNGDPSLTQFPREITPNEHELAARFVQLDNFYDPSNVSYEGWQWSTAARSVDATEKTYTVNYAQRGTTYDSEGIDRGVNVAYSSVATRRMANPMTPNDPDLLPGPRNEEDIDGPAGAPGAGYIWDAALHARLWVRNYGFHCDLTRYAVPADHGGIPPIEHPYRTHTRVAFPAHQALLTLTDPYFRSFDTAYPDFFRYEEWAREFDQFASHHRMPNLTLLRLMNDHMGSYATAIRGVNTPELQVADNDYALGLAVDKVAHSPFAKTTLIFVVEDDAQDGPDHVDAHRSIAFVVGPYVAQRRLVSARYSTVGMICTIEEILGLPPQNLHDAGVRPMVEIFDTSQTNWTYTATPSRYLLKNTRLPFAEVHYRPKQDRADAAPMPKPLHDAAWWAEKTKGFDFSDADLNDNDLSNRVLWAGTMPGRPYPTARSRLDLRHDRPALLKAAGFPDD